jgi:Family of unknown function (DUF6152)
MKLLIVNTALLAFGLAAAFPVASHHSVSMYDRANLIVLDGTIKVMKWRNPHVTIDFVNDATAEQPSRTWTVEVSSPGVMTRSGWTKRSLNPGDRVKVQIAPLRDGMSGGLMRQITLLDSGQVLKWTFADSEKPGVE